MPVLRRIGRFLAVKYATVDARTLGLFRIGYGLLCAGNLYDRLAGSDGIAFYTNDGVIPNHYAIFAPAAGRVWSLLFAVSTPGEVQVAMMVILGIFVLYTVGWKTRAMQILTLIAVLSLDNRILFLQIGGNVVMNVIAVWTLFLPIGDRLSVDSLLRSLRVRRERTAAELRDRSWMAERLPRSFVRLPYALVVLNFAVIYFFNAVHKQGVTWRDGSAVHWVLWQNRIATTFAGWLRMHEPRWVSPMLTWGTLVMEAGLPLLMLTPWKQRWARPLAIFFIVALHGGISAVCTLGPFSYAMMSFAVLLVLPEDWTWLHRRLGRPARARRVIYDDRSRACHALARLLVRFDGLDLLTFWGASEPDRPAVPTELAAEAFVAVDPAGKVESGAEARRAVARALPLGWLWGSVARIALRVVAARRDRVGVALGLGRERAEEPWQPSPARRLAGLAVGGVATALAIWIAICVASQVLMENWAVPARLKIRDRPEAMTAVIDYLRIPQGWSMFAAEAPREDAVLVVDATLADGRHLDLLSGKPPDFDAPFHGPWLHSQQWCEWHARVRHNRQHWRNFLDYLMRGGAVGRRLAGEVSRVEVWELVNRSPAIGSTTPYDVRRSLLFSSDTLK